MQGLTSFMDDPQGPKVFWIQVDNLHDLHWICIGMKTFGMKSEQS